MIEQVDLFRKERKQNEDIIPSINQVEKDVELVKQQILDLNDKFDYIIFMMIKNQKLQKEAGSKDFLLVEKNDIVNEGYPHSDSEIRRSIMEFQRRAQESAPWRNKYRNAPTKIPLAQRVLALKKRKAAGMDLSNIS